METLLRKGQYQARNILNEERGISAILVDIDGTLLPYADKKFKHLYQCNCGYQFTTARLAKAHAVYCPRCVGTYFKRNEPSSDECLSIVRKIISRNISPYRGAQACLRRLAERYPIFYATGRDQIFFKETESWLISNNFPYSSRHNLFMRDSDDGEDPCKLKARLIESFGRGRNIKAIIDDDLSLMSIAEDKRVQFIWAPKCWDKGSHYGRLLRSL